MGIQIKDKLNFLLILKENIKIYLMLQYFYWELLGINKVVLMMFILMPLK